MNFQPLDYSFFFIILLLGSYFGLQFYQKYIMINKETVDGSKLVDAYLHVVDVRRKREKNSNRISR